MESTFLDLGEMVERKKKNYIPTIPACIIAMGNAMEVSYTGNLVILVAVVGEI